MLIPFRKYRLIDLERRPNLLSGPVSTRRQSVPIAVIDDQYFSPVEHLRSNGFDIVQLGNTNDPTTVEKYPIVVCDIQGVGTIHNSELQGGGIIKSLNRLYPEKYIIVYSGSFGRHKAAKVATEYSDDKIVKNASLDEWARKLDKAVEHVSDPVFVWRRVRPILERMENEDTIAKAEDAFVRAVLARKPRKFEKFVAEEYLRDDARAIVQNLVAAALWAWIAV